MIKQQSLLRKLWEWLITLVVFAATGWGGWYAYSIMNPNSSLVNDSVPGTSFNCRKAQADLASDYACMNSGICTMTNDKR